MYPPPSQFFLSLHYSTPLSHQNPLLNITITMEDDETTFSKLSDDVILKIFTQLEDDPRNWARLSCVCTKFQSLISSTCCKSKCIASLSSDLLSLSSSDGWPSLFKLSVCCPGLLHSGVLLDNSDFGLHRQLGLDGDVHYSDDLSTFSSSSSSSSSSQIHHHHHHQEDHNNNTSNNNNHGDVHDGGNNSNTLFEGWSLYDDLYLDTIYNNSESSTPMEVTTGVANFDTEFVRSNNHNDDDGNDNNDFKRRKVVINNDNNNNGEVVAEARRLQQSHLASGVWNLSREQGMKLLASRFRGDCLYISDWPGCIHREDKRNYMLFRGVFSNFKKTRVWRTIKDGNHRSKTDLKCAFCNCNQTWDLHSAFCLKRGVGFHDDGEPVVRAYVCENGHVSGAWTDFPLFT